MNKLKIAHDYFMKHGSPTYLETDIAEAWEYADRMIEQEQRREDKTRPEVLLEKGDFTPSKLDDKWDFAATFGYSGEWRESLRKRP